MPRLLLRIVFMTTDGLCTILRQFGQFRWFFETIVDRNRVYSGCRVDGRKSAIIHEKAYTTLPQMRCVCFPLEPFFLGSTWLYRLIPPCFFYPSILILTNTRVPACVHFRACLGTTHSRVCGYGLVVIVAYSYFVWSNLHGDVSRTVNWLYTKYTVLVRYGPEVAMSCVTTKWSISWSHATCKLPREMQSLCLPRPCCQRGATASSNVATQW